MTDPSTSSSAPAGDRRPAATVPRRGRARAGRLFAGALIVLVVGSVLNPTVVANWADTTPDDFRRDLAHLWADPVVEVSEALGLDTPRNAAEDLIDTDPEVVGFTPADVPTGPVGSAGSPTTGPTDTGEPGGGPGVAPPSSEAPVPPPATTVASRQATAGEPIQIVAFGDSLMIDLAFGLERLLGSRADVEVKGKGALGFGWTKALWDWEEQVLDDYQRTIVEFDPEVVAVMLGANEFDDEEIDGVSRTPGSAAWRDLLIERGNEAISYWVAQGAHVYLWTTPLMGPDKFEQMAALNEIWADLADRWGPAVTLLDSMAVLGDADGGYVDELVLDDGSTVALRKDDGVHFHDVGADRLAEQLRAAMVADGWLLPT